MSRSELEKCDMTTEGLMNLIKERESKTRTANETLKDLKQMRQLTKMGETDAIKEIAEHQLQVTQLAGGIRNSSLKP
jgi:predicted RNase H-like nuclease (RuvC/YqgF family)